MVEQRQKGVIGDENDMSQGGKNMILGKQDFQKRSVFE
jgi:hypothetical protein